MGSLYTELKYRVHVIWLVKNVGNFMIVRFILNTFTYNISTVQTVHKEEPEVLTDEDLEREVRVYPNQKSILIH